MLHRTGFYESVEREIVRTKRLAGASLCTKFRHVLGDRIDDCDASLAAITLSEYDVGAEIGLILNFSPSERDFRTCSLRCILMRANWGSLPTRARGWRPFSRHRM